ncbi:hypothetical protein H7J88_01475 [Mycolicibacterium flavescens]|uniref:hypothetical protein n=1 Tax=Mycolicibacterium flavescens TaxID=1776 RepID=UPI0010426559|nr:hypothetical protein [Mycolicibacterium flavescens]MCV7278314.1 hypothetical protein [Mycolicibacterium flavescens]
MNEIRRLSTAATGALIAGAFGILCAPQAGADYLVPGQPVPPPGDGMGHVSISTEPGGVVHVNVIGRHDAVNSVGPYANGCSVQLGEKIEERFILLDNTGSGTATFGPGERSAPFDGWCGSKRTPAAPTDLFAPHDEVCGTGDDGDGPYEYCITTGTMVVIDGGPPVSAPDFPKPADPYAQEPTQNCAEQIPNSLDRLPPGTELALTRLKGSAFGLYLQVACALVNVAASEDPLNDPNVFTSACKLLESATDPLSIGASKDFFCGKPVS